MIGVAQLEYYHRQGRTLTLTVGKRAFLDGWQERTYSLEELQARWKPGMGIGWITRGEADIDCDSREAVIAAKILAPFTGCVFGRESKPEGHRWYKVLGAEEPRLHFEDPLLVLENRDLPPEKKRSTTIVEYRGGPKAQTVVPDSPWHELDGFGQPTGRTETVQFVKDRMTGKSYDQPSEVGIAVLKRAVAKIAAAALLGRYWSRGERHLCTLALAGFLGRHWPDRDEVRTFIAAIHAVGGDDEDRSADLESTFAKLDANEAVTGLPTLREYMPDAVVTKFAQWLDLKADDGSAYQDSDIGLAEQVRDSFGGQVRYVGRWKQWLYWDGSVWMPDEGAVTVRRHAQNAGRQMMRDAVIAMAKEPKEGLRRFKRAQYASSAPGIANILKSMETIDGVPTLSSEFDRDRFYLTVSNGTIDLRSRELLPHDPAHLISKKCELTYDEALTISGNPLWDAMPHFTEYLASSLVHKERGPDDEWYPDNELIEALQLYLGYSITGETKMQIFFLLIGEGGNGKGTLMRLLKHMFRAHFKTAAHTVFLGKKRDHDTVKASLEGCRICETGEVEEGESMAVAIVKEFSGENEIECRRMRGDTYGFTPQLKLWMACNNRPVIEDASDGPWRRIKPIMWWRKFTDADRDVDLDAKLVSESTAILAWIVRGAAVLYSNGFVIEDPQAVVDLRDEYRRESDQMQRFVDEACAVGPEGTGTLAELSDAYLAWALSSGLKPKGKGDWRRWMVARYELRKQNGAFYFRGISPLKKAGW